MFVDEVVIEVKAGDGGDGCTGFRREKYIPMGGPAGGNGGRGSDIIFKVDLGLKTLLDLRYKRLIKGNKGGNGLGKNMHGKGAEDIIIKVPQGTTITDLDTGLILGDLTKENDEVIVAKGGRGGRGNTAFATHNNPAPNFSENGEPGEQRKLKVELKLLADVGFVGMPSVGKSTLISKISKAKPKIAAYHFTTLSPNLGVVKTKDNRTFVAADLPGLIEGASLGEGLGDQFLKHIERTRVIAHIVDMSGFEGRNPYEDYVKINKELENFDSKLIKKPQIIIANKMDMPQAKENLKEFKKKVKDEVYEISALNNEGIDEVLIKIADELDKLPTEQLYEDDKFESHVLYKFKKEQPFSVYKENNIYVVRGDEIEKLLKMTKFTDEGARRFANKLRKLGVDDKLRELGVQEGDIVRILDFEFEFRE
jgi:GTP-binding protein